MPIPLPDLDSRRWSDLVEEGRALIPRYAPDWTDQNVHDPGITLIELFAWLAESAMYRANRVPPQHRRKFLQLIGFAPAPPMAARVALTFDLAPMAPSVVLPAGLTLATQGPPGTPVPYRLLAPVTVVRGALAQTLSFDGSALTDLSPAFNEGLPLAPWGPDPAAQPGTPEHQPAFYLGFDVALPVGTPVSMWLWIQDPESGRERERLAALAASVPPAPCAPPAPGSQRECGTPPGCDPWCDDDATGAPPPPEPAGPVAVPIHHSVRTVWDYHASTGWEPLDPAEGEVSDWTRGLSLSGPVVLTLPGPMGPVSPAGGPPRFFLRCRLASGVPDSVPVVGDVAVNTVEAEQSVIARSTFVLAPGVVPPPGEEPVAGMSARIRVAVDQSGAVTSVAADPGSDVPETLVIGYEPATATVAGILRAGLVALGDGTGTPWQAFPLPAAPVDSADTKVWTDGAHGVVPWSRRPDLDGSGRTDAHYMLDPTAGVVVVGDGERGCTVEPGNQAFAVYDVTRATEGNVARMSPWSLPGADDDVNRMLLGSEPSVMAASLGAISNRAPAEGGAAAELLDHAAGRAAATLWAHERLLELNAGGSGVTLDQLDRAAVMALQAPGRASTLVDFERLALDVPGTRVARVRAWAGVDPDLPCFAAEGTVTVVVVPYLPRNAPTPTPGLLRAVRSYLDARRVICTRLLVVGPAYLEVSVHAGIRTREGADAARVIADVVAAVNAFLHPLTGGPAARGWPFGRDVYRSEILGVIAGVAGVDHVASLELVPGTGEADCGNLCVGPTWLVTPGVHVITAN